MNDTVFIIAEAGVNHNGSLDLALQLVDAAADARAQTRRSDALFAVLAQLEAQDRGLPLGNRGRAA